MALPCMASPPDAMQVYGEQVSDLLHAERGIGAKKGTAARAVMEDEASEVVRDTAQLEELLRRSTHIHIYTHICD